MENTKINYIQKGICFDVEVEIEISIIPGDSEIILLTVPGVDGSINGYNNKYKRIAENINRKYGATVVRMSNPYNLMRYHYRNLFEVLDFIEQKYDMSKKKLYAMGHSLGAYMAGATAHMYDYIDKILLINPATGLEQSELSNLQNREKNKNIILIGEKDPSYKNRDEYSKYAKIHVVKNADHHFSGHSFTKFINAADKYLFDKK